MKEFLSMDTKKIIADLNKNKNQELANLSNVQQRKETEDQFDIQINKFKKIEHQRDLLISKSSEMRKAYFGITQWHKDNDRNIALALEIGIEARKVYDDLYQASKNLTPNNNSCRDFKL